MTNLQSQRLPRRGNRVPARGARLHCPSRPIAATRTSSSPPLHQCAVRSRPQAPEGSGSRPAHSTQHTLGAASGTPAALHPCPGTLPARLGAVRPIGPERPPRAGSAPAPRSHEPPRRRARAGHGAGTYQQGLLLLAVKVLQPAQRHRDAGGQRGGELAPPPREPPDPPGPGRPGPPRKGRGITPGLWGPCLLR